MLTNKTQKYSYKKIHANSAYELMNLIKELKLDENAKDIKIIEEFNIGDIYYAKVNITH